VLRLDWLKCVENENSQHLSARGILVPVGSEIFDKM
jgi:hypothetical protein